MLMEEGDGGLHSVGKITPKKKKTFQFPSHSSILCVFLHKQPYISDPPYSCRNPFSQSCGCRQIQVSGHFRPVMWCNHDVNEERMGGENVWLWPWHGWWCQTGWFKYFENCWSPNRVYTECCKKETLGLLLKHLVKLQAERIESIKFWICILPFSEVDYTVLCFFSELLVCLKKVFPSVCPTCSCIIKL